MFRPRLIAIVGMCVIAGCDHDAPNAALPDPPIQIPRSEPLRVRVTGRDFKWHLRYPGPDRRLDTADDVFAQRHLHLPMNADIELELRSADFVYSLYLPDYELVEMAFPGRPYVVEFTTWSEGTSRLLGSQMCGFTHEQLLGDLVVQTPADFRRWSGQQSHTARSTVSPR
ncbi:MAG: hypothetical protein E2O40_06745 [Planctomycetota bacterium]|nr:MAG: hypothetical protein E2O40_06745 [Planctomycetota bacterium]